jgi:hypothetical protein
MYSADVSEEHVAFIFRAKHAERASFLLLGYLLSLESRRMEWVGHVERMGAKRNAYRLLVGGPEGKRPLQRPRRRWMDKIKMDLVE